MSEKKNKGGNSDLDGKYWNCPDYVLNCFKRMSLPTKVVVKLRDIKELKIFYN